MFNNILKIVFFLPLIVFIICRLSQRKFHPYIAVISAMFLFNEIADSSVWIWLQNIPASAGIDLVQKLHYLLRVTDALKWLLIDMLLIGGACLTFKKKTESLAGR